MGNESAKKRKKENAELMSKYGMILLGCNVSARRRVPNCLLRVNTIQRRYRLSGLYAVYAVYAVSLPQLHMSDP